MEFYNPVTILKMPPECHPMTLEELFTFLINSGKESLIEKGEMPGCTFFIFRDVIKNEYNIGSFPILVSNREELNMYTYILKGLIKNFKENPHKDHRLVATIQGVTAFMNTVPASCLKSDGKLDMDKVVMPSQDKDHKNVVSFILEEIHKRHMITYEYVESDDGSVVINPEPIIDNKSTYNEIEARNANFAFIFTEPSYGVN